MEQHVARPILDPLFQNIVDMGGSDLYLTVGLPPCIRVNDGMHYIGEKPLLDEDMEAIIAELLAEDKRDEFSSTFELNTAIAWQGKARFRINVFRQQQHNGIVIRRIQTDIPTTESLNLPDVYRELVLERRGLVLVVGPTGSGKSTSLAAMIGYRNTHGSGHVITVEDPIEFVHQHNKCIITQRDLGIDTYSMGLALKNALRQRPDVVLIGEIRDRETMEHAINFSETGHLCLGTLHANNANQAIERVLNFFPEEKHRQVLINLSLNLKGILSQRLVANIQGTRSLAIEIMLNRGLIRNLIEENKTKEIKDVMEKNRGQGMQTFDQCLLEMFLAGTISEEVAIAESDNPANIRLNIRQRNTAKKISSGTAIPGAPPLTSSQPMVGSLHNFRLNNDSDF